MLFHVLIMLFFIIIMIVLRTSRKNTRFFIFINSFLLCILNINIYLCNPMRANIPLIVNKNMEIYPGELRFCEDCIHRTKVNGLQNDEILCEKLGISLKTGSEANQCLLSGDFEETAVAKEARENFHIRDLGDLLMS